MADPFSIAASSAGVVSLGITACQGLLKYYESYRQSGSAVANMYTQLLSLTKTLDLIDDFMFKQPLHLAPGTSEKLGESLENCRVAALSLEKKLKKIKFSTEDDPPSTQRITSFMHKASFPFRESTLVRLKEIVMEFRSDLVLVLEVLQMDASAVSLRKMNGIEQRLDLIAESSAKTSATVLGFGQDIEVISDILSTTQIDEERRRIHEWLRPPDPFTNHAAARSKHEQSTNQWLMETTELSTWLNSRNSLLVLHGIPGCGKTILASSVIAALEERSIAEKFLLLYSYFDFNDRQKQSVHGCLASLLLQMALVTYDFRELISMYTDCGEGGRPPSTEELLKALQCAISVVPKVYLVVDALDECAQEDYFVQILTSILRTWPVNISILVTSRKSFDLELESVSSKTFINIQQALIEADIQVVIRVRLQQNVRLARWCKDLKVKEEIEKTLTQGANGMFRWVAYQMDELQRCLTISSLRKTLQRLPKTLFETYDRIIQQIDPVYYGMTFTILQWLCVSRRPLVTNEAAEAVTIVANPETRRPIVDEANRFCDPSDVFIVCSSLIQSQSSSSSDKRNLAEEPLSLAHYSVKEYLYSDSISLGPCAAFRIEEAEAHAFIARSCIAYLLKLDLQNGAAMGQGFPLAKYASEYWSVHAEAACRAQGSDDLDELIIELLESETAMLKVRQIEKSHYPAGVWKGKPALHWAAQYGFTEVGKKLLARGEKVDTRDTLQRTALHEAVRYRKIAFVRLLLTHDSALDPLDAFPGGGTPLHYAIFNRDREAVLLLLRAGANPNIRSNSGKTPLFCAVERGDTVLVKRLLDDGCDPDVLCQIGYQSDDLQTGHPLDPQLENPTRRSVNISALQVAVWSGFGTVLELLLSAGAEVKDEGIQLLAQGKVQDALETVGRAGSFSYAWHNDLPDYEAIAKVLRAHAERRAS